MAKSETANLITLTNTKCCFPTTQNQTKYNPLIEGKWKIITAQGLHLNASLLKKHFYQLKPSKPLSLFTNSPLRYPANHHDLRTFHFVTKRHPLSFSKVSSDSRYHKHVADMLDTTLFLCQRVVEEMLCDRSH